MQSTYLVGDYVASEASVFCVPRLWKADGTHRGMLYLHGAGETATNITGVLATQPKEAAMFSRLVNEFQIPIYSADLGGPGASGTTGTNSWGNSNAQTRVGQAKTAIQAAGAKSGKVILFGISMGVTTALNYAKNNPSNVSAVIGVLPAIDLNDIRVNDRGGIGLRAAIDSAWAVTYPAALPAGADPSVYYSGLSGVVPIYLAYASDDAIAVPGSVTTFAGNVTSTLVNLGTGGHTDASVGHVDVAAIYTWLQNNNAL